ncbi:MAG: patatin-like phospholipase family protein [Janthinobacterium lividum]
MADRGLVLGGGGVTGIAWMTGLLLGLSEEGFDVLAAERIIGTSAGSAVGAQISSGTPLPELFQRQTVAELQVHELQPTAEQRKTVLHTLPALMHIGDSAERLRCIGTLALETATVGETERRQSIAERLPILAWPERALTVVAVDVFSGESRFFDRNSGVDVVDAVAASCAVPGLWPPVTIGEHRYMDGGIRSSDNADLAADCERLLVISPLGRRTATLQSRGLPAQTEQRTRAGLHTFVIEPDEATHRVMGTDPFDAGKRAITAEAGRAQGRSLGVQSESLLGQPLTAKFRIFIR